VQIEKAVVTSPAAQKIKDVRADPPKRGWNRRRFLQKIAAAGVVPLLTESPAFAEAQHDAGRIKITDIKVQQLIVEKDWGTYTDYVGAHTAILYGGGREGGLGGVQRPVGIEIALWDLIGKAANQPLYKLWGGTRDRIMPYSSMFKLGPSSQRAETALELKSQGWKAIKLKSHYATLKEDVAQLEAVRNACGPDFIITTDGNKAGFSVSFQGTRGVPWSFQRALETAKECERLEVFWLEEPLPRYDFERLAELNRLTTVNLAGGEAQNPGVQEFRWLLEKGCFDVIQPEINTQGVAVLQKVAVIAESMEKLICPHLGDGRLSTVCDMHLVATWPNAPLLECSNEIPEGAYEHSYAVFEEPIKLTKDGYFELPTKPGLGVAIRKDLYKKG